MLKTLNLVLIGLLIAGAGWTFMVKHNAEEASQRLARLRHDIRNERDEIDLLRADWALLSSPRRLEELVRTYNSELGLVNLDARQIVELGDLPEMKRQRPKADEAIAQGEEQPDLLSTGSITGASIPDMKSGNEGQQ